MALFNITAQENILMLITLTLNLGGIFWKGFHHPTLSLHDTLLMHVILLLNSHMKCPTNNVYLRLGGVKLREQYHRT